MEEYLSSIKQCFKLFYDATKDKIKSGMEVKLNYDNMDLDLMSTDQISADANVLYMGYVVSAVYTVNSDTYISVAYKQLMSMVNEYMNIYQRNYTLEYLKDEKKRLEKENCELKKENKRLIMETNEEKTEEKTPTDDKKKGWFS